MFLLLFILILGYSFITPLVENKSKNLIKLSTLADKFPFLNRAFEYVSFNL